MSTTSVGRGPASGGNENHDGDPTNKTLGESVRQEPPAGNDLIDAVTQNLPAGVPGTHARQGASERPGAYPDGPNVEDSPWELDAARGKPPA